MIYVLKVFVSLRKTVSISMYYKKYIQVYLSLYKIKMRKTYDGEFSSEKAGCRPAVLHKKHFVIGSL